VFALVMQQSCGGRAAWCTIGIPSFGWPSGPARWARFSDPKMEHLFQRAAIGFGANRCLEMQSLPTRHLKFWDPKLGPEGGPGTPGEKRPFGEAGL
jgi:hypothetical protein